MLARRIALVGNARCSLRWPSRSGHEAGQGMAGPRRIRTMCRVIDERSWVTSARVVGTCQWCGHRELLEASVEVDHDCGADALETLSVGDTCLATIRAEGLPLAYAHD